MIDLEKLNNVIKGMEFCLTPYNPAECDDADVCPYTDCPYFMEYNMGDCIRALCKDAIALLKAQEPRVMSVIEVDTWVSTKRIEREPIVIEVRDRYIAWIVGYEYGDLPGANLSREFYGKTYRCWTSRPTDEQKKAVKWDA